MANSFTIEAFSLLGVGLTAIGIRTYARWSTVGFRGLKPDDFLMLGAAVGTPLPRVCIGICLNFLSLSMQNFLLVINNTR